MRFLSSNREILVLKRKSTSFILYRASKTKWRLSNTLYNELNERYKTADRRLSWIYRIIWNYEWEPTYPFPFNCKQSSRNDRINKSNELIFSG